MRYLALLLLFARMLSAQTTAPTTNMPGNIQPQSIGGNILYVTPTGYTNLAAAFAACPAVGCTIDMRGNNASAAVTLGTFDPVTTPVTILLGPYSNYTVNQITLRSGLQIIGTGHNSTFITQAAAGTAPFVLPGAGQTYPNNVANGVHLEGFNLIPAGGSTTDGFSLIASPASGATCNGGSGTCGGGIWYSRLVDVTVSLGWGRNALRFDATNQGSVSESTNQFLTLDHVVAFRLANGAPALNAIGPFVGQFTIINSQFDGPSARTDTSPVCNINIGDGGVASYLAYSVLMTNVTSQWAWGVGSAAICLTGVAAFKNDGGHFENDNGLIKETIGGGGHGNWGVKIGSAYIATSSVNSGNGFLASLDANSQLTFDTNTFFGTPDQTFIGAGAGNVTSLNNTNFSAGGFQPWTQINFGIGIPFANLPTSTATNGTLIYCPNCTIANPCASGGTGAFAKRLNSVWVCN